MLSVLNVKNRNVTYMYGTESKFNTGGIVHNGIVIPIRVDPKGPTWVLRVEL